MYAYKRGETTGVLNTAASLILFLLFTVCMLVIIGAGAGIYGRINSNYETTYGSAVGVKYISNKIRSSDSCEIIENGKAVALKSGNILCVIYSGENGIYEKNTSVDNPVSASGGSLVVEAEEMLVSEADGLYRITVNDCEVLVRKGDTSE